MISLFSSGLVQQAPKLPSTPTHEASPSRWAARAGKVRPMILLWALGVPIPLIILFFLIRGCM